MIYIKTIWLIFLARISIFFKRNKSFEQRYENLRHWALRIFHTSKSKMIVEGAEKIPHDKAVYFVSNHQGTLDPLLIVAACPIPTSFISKKENAKIWFLGSCSRALEVIFFDRNDSNSAIFMLREASRKLKAGRNLLIFPEGTRSKSAQTNEFKHGALQPAYLTKSVIVPVALVNSYELWDQLRAKGTVKIIFSDPIQAEDYKNIKSEELAVKLRELIQKNVDESLK